MPKMAAGSSMDVVAAIDSQVQGLIAHIDAQISQLTAKKSALVNAFGGGGDSAPEMAGAPRRGRPPGSANKAAESAAPAKAASKKGKKKRVFSEETRQKLAAKAKERWDRIRAEAAAAGKPAKAKGGKDKAA